MVLHKILQNKSTYVLYLLKIRFPTSRNHQHSRTFDKSFHRRHLFKRKIRRFVNINGIYNEKMRIYDRVFICNCAKIAQTFMTNITVHIPIYFVVCHNKKTVLVKKEILFSSFSDVMDIRITKQRNRVFATNSNVLILISLHHNVVIDLK